MRLNKWESQRKNEQGVPSEKKSSQGIFSDKTVTSLGTKLEKQYGAQGCTSSESVR